MSSPDNRLELLKSFLFGDLPASEFYDQYGIVEDDVEDEVVRLLAYVRDTRDGKWVEAAMTLGWRHLPGRFPDEARCIIEALVTENFHVNHEGMISLLQGWRSPSSIPSLVGAIELKPDLDYLAYDDYGVFYKRCLWALVAIGTPEAKALVEGYTRSPIPELREQAVYRLGKFGDDAAWSAASLNEKKRLDAKRRREAQACYRKARNRRFWMRLQKGLLKIPWALRSVVLGLWFGGAMVALCSILPAIVRPSGAPPSWVEVHMGKVCVAGYAVIMEGILLYFGSRIGRAILFVSVVLGSCLLIQKGFAMYPVLWWVPAGILMVGISIWFLYFYRPTREFFDQK